MFASSRLTFRFVLACVIATLIASLLAANSAHAQTANTLAYFGGDGQVALPSSALPANMQVVNQGSGTLFVRFTITGDSTGGALLGNGQSTHIYSLGTGTVGNESMTFGPANGVTQVAACLGVFSPSTFVFSCTSNTVSFTQTARTFAITQVSPSADPTTVLPNATLTVQARASYNGAAPPGGFISGSGLTWSIVSDSTGGARINGGTASVFVAYDSSGLTSVSVRVGPNTGSVQLAVRADPVIIGKATSANLPLTEPITLAVAPPAPVILATNIQNVTASSALLSAAVDDKNITTMVSFGLRTGSGSGSFSTVGTATAQASSSTQVVSTTANSLACGTNYQYQATASNASGNAVSSITTFTTAACPQTAPTVTLTSTGNLRSGQDIVFTADATGGAGGYTYFWDFDGDGATDRVGTTSTLTANFAGINFGTPSVTVRDSAGASTRKTLPLNITSPALSVTTNGAAVQLCGDGDGVPEPGERWRVPVRISNATSVAASDGYAIFAAQDRVDAASTEGINGKLLVETPTIGVGNLAPGAFVDSMVDVKLASDASCGSTYSLRFQGGTDLNGAAGNGSTLFNFVTPVTATCQVATSCASPAQQSLSKAQVVPREGFFFNSARPGNGLSMSLIPVAGGDLVYSGLWFTGTPEHLPTWYALQAPMLGNAAVSPIYKFTQDLSSPTFKVNRSVVGNAVVAMLGSQRILLNWQMGDKSGTELMDYYIGGNLPNPNRTGAWYNIPEAGSGLMVHPYVQPGTGTQRVFAMHFIYDSNGQPRWTFLDDTPGNAAAGTQAQTFTSVHCPGCPYLPDWSSFLSTVGTAKLLFTDPSNGSYSTSINLPSPLAGSWMRTELPLTILTKPQ